MLGFLIILMAGVAFAQDPARCFKRHGNCDIIYSNPYEKVWRIDVTGCLQKCAVDQPKCKAVVYDSAFSICNLYPFSGNSGPGFLIPAFKKVYYQVNDTSCLSSITSGPLIEPVTAPLPAEGPIVGGVTAPTLSPSILVDTTLASGAPTVPTVPTVPTAPSVSARALVNIAKPTKPPKASARVSCSDGKQPVYLGLMETSVTTPDGLADGSTASNIGDPSTCIKSCTVNEDPAGKAIDCQSFTYNSVNQKCSFHPFIPLPDGPADTINIVGMNTFVKACVTVTPENSKCKNAMLITAPGVELSGHTKKSLSGIKSLVECLERCLTETSCKSLNYFYKERRCILHDTDSLANPEAIGVATDNDTIYVENTCAVAERRQMAHVDRETVNRFESKLTQTSEEIQLRQPKEDNKVRTKAPEEDETKFTAWTSWTKCVKRTHGASVRIRVRGCKDSKSPCQGRKAEYKKC